MFLQQPPSPIVVEVLKQPPITREINMGDVVLGAVGLTGTVMIAALSVGLIVGGLFVFYRKSREGATPRNTNPGHAILGTQDAVK